MFDSSTVSGLSFTGALLGVALLVLLSLLGRTVVRSHAEVPRQSPHGWVGELTLLSLLVPIAAAGVSAKVQVHAYGWLGLLFVVAYFHEKLAAKYPWLKVRPPRGRSMGVASDDE